MPGKEERIKKGIRSAALTSAVFCAVISILVLVFAGPLMQIFIDPGETEILAVGVQSLRIEGACYIGIGIFYLIKSDHKSKEPS